MAHSDPAFVPANDPAGPPLRELSGFNYAASAELFPNRSRRTRRTLGYKRFETAAEAIRFIIEEIPAPAMLGAYLQVDDARFTLEEVHRLYGRPEYPLTRAGEAPAPK
jgi:hypothetical protein